MGHNKTDSTKSPYQLARKKAAKSEPQLASRENASELLLISSQSLQNYESGKTPIPAETVVRMANLYNEPQLRHYYCHHDCAIGRMQTYKFGEEQLELDRLTLRLLSTFKEVTNIKDDLIEIAADGIITKEEKPTFERVISTLDMISKHTEALKIWAEKEFAKMEKR